MVALGNLLAMNKNYDQANAVADAVIAKFKNYGDAYILKGDIYAMQDNGGEAATWYGQCMTWILRILRDISAILTFTVN